MEKCKVFVIEPKYECNNDGDLIINGYKLKTTFWNEFSAVEKYGVDALECTFSRIFKHNCDNYIYITELVMILNWKIWKHYKKDAGLAAAYQVLWRLANRYAVENLKDEELKYFFNTTD